MSSGIEYGIKIKLDGSQEASSGIDQVTTATTKLGATSESVSQKLAATQKDLNATTSQLTLGQAAFLDKLRDQAEQAGMSRVELLKLQAAQMGLSDVSAGMIGQIESATKGHHELNLASAGTTRELMVLGHEAMTGNFSRMAGSMMVLTNRTGGMQVAIESLSASTIGFGVLGAAAIAGIVYAMEKGHEEFVAMDNALKITSGYAGMTASDMHQLADSMTYTKEVTIGTANAIVLELVKSGRIGGEAIGVISKLASDYAKSTGQDIEKVAPVLMKLFEDPLKGAEELNKSMHFLTTTQIEHIAALERTGRAEQAQLELAELLSIKLPEQAKHISPLTKLYNELADAASRAADGMKRALGAEQSNAQQLEKLKQDRALFLDHGASPTSDVVKKYDVDIAAKERLIAEEKKMAEATTARAAAIKLQADSWDAAKKSSQLYHIQELQDRLKLIQQHQSEPGADFAQQEAVKQDAIRKTQKEIEDANRAVGAVSRGLSQEQIAGQEALREINLKSAADQIETQFKLGQLTKDQFDMQMTNNALDIVTSKILFEQQSLQIGGLTAQERKRHEDKLAQLQAEWDLAEQKGVNKQLIDEKQSYDDIIKAIVSTGTAENTRLANAIELQKKHNAEIGKTAEQKALAIAQIEDEGTKQLENDAEFLTRVIAENDFNDASRSAYEMRLKYIQDEIDGRKKLAGLIRDGAAAEASAASAKKAQDEWKTMADNIDHFLSSAIEHGFTGTKGFITDFVKSIEAMFAKMVLRPLLAPISGDIASMVTGTAGAASSGTSAMSSVGGWLNGASSLKTGWDTATGGFSTAYTNMATSTYGQSAGLSTATSTGASVYQDAYVNALLQNATAEEANTVALAAQQQSMTSLGSTLGTVGSYVGAGLAGIAIGSAIAGDKKIGGLNGTAVSAGGAVAGAYIGAEYGSIGGPLGAFIGGIVGGLVGAAFGMGDKHADGVPTIHGTFSAGSFSGQNEQAWSQDGGWFRSDRHGTDTAPIAKNQQTALNNLVSGTQTVFNQLIAASGNANKSLTGWTFSINQAATTAEEQKKLTVDLATSMGTFLVPELAAFSTTGENLADTAVRLKDEFLLTTSAANILGKSSANAFGAVGFASVAMREQFVALLGGMQKATTSIQDYYTNFFSDSERHANDLAALSKQFGTLGIAMPSTREALRALVEQQNLSTTAGQEMAASLIGLSSAFAAVVPAVIDGVTTVSDAIAALATVQSNYDTAVGGLTSATQTAASSYQSFVDAVSTATTGLASARQAIADQYQSAVDAQTTATAAVKSEQDKITAGYVAASDKLAQVQAKIVDGFAKLSTSLKSFLGTLAASDIAGASPAQQYAALKAQFSSQSALAMGGDQNAAGTLAGVASNLLKADQSQAVDALALARDVANVKTTIGNVVAMADSKVAVATPAVDELTAALAAQQQWSDAVKASGASYTQSAIDILSGYRMAVTAQTTADTAVTYWADIAQTAGVSLNTTSDAMHTLGATLLQGYTDAQTALATANTNLAAANVIKSNLDLRQTTALETFVTQIESLNTAIAALATATSASASAAAAAGVTVTTPQTPLQVANAALAVAPITADYNSILGRAPDAAGLQFWTTQMANGVSPEAIAAAFKASNEYKATHSFAVGTNQVPFDMTAKIHQDERIIPAADNRELMSRLRNPAVNNDALVAEIRALRSEVAALRGSSELTAKSSKKTADTIERVTRGGEGMVISADSEIPVTVFI